MEVKIVDVEQQNIALLEHRGDPLTLMETAVKFDQWRNQLNISHADGSQTYGIFIMIPAR